MLQVLTAVAPLFLVIFASAILKKFTKIGEGWEKILNEFAFKVGLPVLLFSALAKTSFSFTEESTLIIANSVFLIVSFILAVLVGKIARLKKQMFLTLFICFVFGNMAYLGIPVLTEVVGENAIPEASLIIGIYLFWIFTVGLGYLDYSLEKSKKDVFKKILKNLFLNPLLLSVILGLIFGALTIPIHPIIEKSLSMVSASVTPVVLVVIGLFIGTSTIGKLSEWIPVLIFSIFTLIILPAIFYYGLEFTGHNPSNFFTSIIEAAMPLAITPFALADKYNLNKSFIARSIVLSTIISAISLPFWISIL